ncbi:MAG: hypothetical protein HOJ07_09925 [Rhodospirillaceae bacterium]|nr:hypothetical protein [Rhodospirillaceae bacterium]
MTSKSSEIIRLSDHTAIAGGRRSAAQQSIFRRHDLSEVDLALFNEVIGTRAVLSDSMRGIGFRPFRTNVVNALDGLRVAVRRGDIDMLVLEANQQPRDVYNLVHEIRNGKLGPNPFLVISIVTWRADKGLIQAFLKAGADDVVVMPASISFASGRVDNLIDNRREFVVTTSYVGPDRRLRSRAMADELGTILVPNGLRYKATGDESANPNGARLQRINRVVQEHRLRRLTLRLESLTGQLEYAAAEQPDAPPQSACMSELSDLISRITSLTKDDGRMTVSELITSLGAVQAATEGRQQVHSDIFALLKVHSQALLAMQRGDKEAADLVVRAVRTAANVVDERTRQGSGDEEDVAIRI